MNRRLAPALIALAAVCYSAPAAAQSCPRTYNIYDLGPIQPEDINNNDEVVGLERQGPFGTEVAVSGYFDSYYVSWGWPALWLYHLAPPGIPNGVSGHRATAISDNGEIIGSVDDLSYSNSRAYTWDMYDYWNHGPVPVHGPPAGGLLNSRGNDVNNNGTLIGNTGTMDGWIWQNGNQYDAAALNGGMSTAVSDLNDADWVIGQWFDPQAQMGPFAYAGEATSWGYEDLHGCLNTTQPSGFTKSWGELLDNGGMAVVNGEMANGNSQLFVLDRATCSKVGLTASVGPNSIDPVSSDAVNNQGQIVGTGAYGNFEYPFLYENGTTYNLNNCINSNSGWVAHVATGINDRGVIVGSGELNGVEVGFALEPSTLWWWD